MKKYRCLIFDFDMTLFDTSRGSSLCYEKAFESIGASYNQESLKTYMSESLEKTYQHISNPHGSCETFVNTFSEASQSLIMKYSLIYPDVEKCLLELSNKYKLAIVTNKDKVSVLNILNYFNINESIFDEIIGYFDVKSKKPHEEGLILCMEKLKMPKNRCVYIGDCFVDREFAKNAGIDSLIIDRNHYTDLNSGTISSLEVLL